MNIPNDIISIIKQYDINNFENHKNKFSICTFLIPSQKWNVLGDEPVHDPIFSTIYIFTCSICGLQDTNFKDFDDFLCWYCNKRFTHPAS